MLIVNLLWVPLITGWGGVGHRAITDVSLNLLTDTIRRWITSELEDVNSASVWADTREASTKYPGSDLYHFSNTPYKNCAAFNFDRDCGTGSTKGICIVTGLTEAIVRSVDPNISDNDRRDSLKFILHFMADIHQPLHTGFRTDSGGLRIRLGVPANRDLHYIWDTWLIDEYIRSLPGSSANKLSEDLSTKLTAEFQARLQVNITSILRSRDKIFAFVSDIASDTSVTATCEYGYKDERGEYIGVGSILTQSYARSRFPHLVVQLLKASVRLTMLLEGIGQQILANRLARKALIRLARQARLFANLQRSKKAANANYFASLVGEIDLDAYEWKGEDKSSSVRKPMEAAKPRRTAAVSAKPEDELLDKAAIAGAAELASYTFEGINLSQIVLVKRQGRWIITSKLNALDRTYIPKSSWLVTMILNPGTEEVFSFDDSVFPLKKLDNDELIIRTILQIFKIDPRIDLDDYADIKPKRKPKTESSAILDAINNKLKERAEREYEGEVERGKTFRTLSDYFIEKLEKNLTDIVIVHLSSTAVGFVSKMTLARSDTMTRVKFNRLSFANKIAGKIEYAMVDPAIFNGRMNAMKIQKILRDLINSRSARFPSDFENRIIRELVFVEKITTKKADMSQMRELQGVHGNYINTEHGYMMVIEWIRRSQSFEWAHELFSDDPETVVLIYKQFSTPFKLSIKKVCILVLLIITIIVLFRRMR